MFFENEAHIFTMEPVCLYQMLPMEMIEAIIKSVRDTKTILNLRKVDKFFYSRLQSVKIFENNNEIGYFKFSNNRFSTVVNDKLQKEIIFKRWGEYIYKEYNQIGLAKIIGSKPLKTNMRDYTNPRLIEITDYDVANSKETVRNIPTVPACAIS